MGKVSLPSVDDHKGPAVVKPTELPSSPPTSEATEGYVSTQMVDIRKRADTKLTTAQAIKLRDKIRELQDNGATLEDGSYINSKSDAIRWMIEHPLSTVR